MILEITGKHLLDRTVVRWGSYGKYGDKPLRWTIIQDISDSHLMRIVEHLKYRPACNDMLQLMKNEVTYRTKELIFIPETYD
jgi:hypothetical protein